MSDNDILKQIALLNPRIINGNEGGNNVDYILNNGSSSPSEVNTDITDNQLVENDDDNDILNLWSSTKIFFDPFDPSKINTTHSQNSLSTPSLNSNNIDAGQLSEREIDRQRYNRLKQQQQSIYAQRGRRSLKENSEHNNIFNKNNLLDINNFEHFLLNNNNTDNDNHNHNNNNNKNAVENSLLQASTSTNTAHSLATTQSIIQNISLPANNNVTKLNSINNNQDFNKKNKDLYTQLLDSINIIKDDDINANGKRNGVSKTNESRSKELAEKKKRRSAATMRCRERKKKSITKEGTIY